jgi:uncharacterized protein YdeI (YjbR/CyaY-like superfamily)
MTIPSHGAATMLEPSYFASAADFRDWLTAHHDQASELLVGFRKLGSGLSSISWPESVDEALCFGWIDGVRRRIDERSYSVRFTPRRAGSIWSAVNLAKVESLIAAGRMQPAGLKAWQARDPARERVYSFEQAEVAELDPAERAQFEAKPAAWRYFESTPPGYRKTLLHWIVTAKKPETRTRRLAELIGACAEQRRLR